MTSVVDPDPVGAASFCRIRIQIGILGLPIRIVIRIHFSQMSSLIILFLEHFNIVPKILKIMTPMTLPRNMNNVYTGAAVNKR